MHVGKGLGRKDEGRTALMEKKLLLLDVIAASRRSCSKLYVAARTPAQSLRAQASLKALFDLDS